MAKDSKTGNTIITEAQAKARTHWFDTRGGRRGRQERALARLMADPHPCTQTTFDIERLQVKLGYRLVEG